MLRLQIVSDLHLEFGDIVIENTTNADVLILSGDIMLAEDLYKQPIEKYKDISVSSLKHSQARAHRFREFLKRVCSQFADVIYVAGNHEFYGGRWVDSIKHLRAECAVYPNLHFLEQDCVTIKDVTFVGGTLWTDMNKIDPLTLHATTDLMNDFKVIRNDEAGFTALRPAHTVSRHRRTLEYIKLIVGGQHDKTFVVVGHHTPSSLSTHPKFVNEYLMNGAFSSDLSEFILDHPQIKLWTCGHTHHSHRYYIGDTLVVCNPRGYEGKESGTGFHPSKCVELGNLPTKEEVDSDYKWANF